MAPSHTAPQDVGSMPGSMRRGSCKIRDGTKHLRGAVLWPQTLLPQGVPHFGMGATGRRMGAGFTVRLVANARASRDNSARVLHEGEAKQTLLHPTRADRSALCAHWWAFLCGVAGSGRTRRTRARAPRGRTWTKLPAQNRA